MDSRVRALGLYAHCTAVYDSAQPSPQLQRPRRGLWVTNAVRQNEVQEEDRINYSSKLKSIQQRVEEDGKEEGEALKTSYEH